MSCEKKMNIEVTAWIIDSTGNKHLETVILTEPQLLLLARKTLTEKYGERFGFLAKEVTVKKKTNEPI